MNAKIIVDSEWMKNQKQAQVMGSQQRFQALQTKDGNALFFSIGTDKAFYLCRELPGNDVGWAKVDLGANVSQGQGGKTLPIRTFSVMQNLQNNTVDILLAVEGKDQDQVFTVQGLPNTDTTWTHPLPWQALPYDNPQVPLSKLVVSDFYITQSSQGEYLVADVLSHPDEPSPFINRFFLDPSKKITGLVWNEHSLAADLDANTITSCLGRKAGQLVEGIYTLGKINDVQELLYAPLYNPFNPKLPSLPSRLAVPQSAAALATAPAADSETNLYVAGGGQLSLFSPDRQNDGSVGVVVLRHDLFTNVTALFTNSDSANVYVWGLNQQGQIFYTRCARGSEAQPIAWSVPVPIATNVTQIATYLNNQYPGNVIFAHKDGTQMLQLTQNPVTSLWEQRNIVLPTTNLDDVLEFNTFTSHMVVTNEANQPLGAQVVMISSISPVSVYINNQFNILSPSAPLPVTADATGVITILQETQSASAVCYNLQLRDSATVVNVNPMLQMVKTLANIKTGDDLSKVTVTNADGSRQPLVDKSVSADAKDATAQAIQQFVSAANSVPQNGSTVDQARISHTRHLLMTANFLSTPTSVWGMSFENGQPTYHSGTAAMQQFGLMAIPAIPNANAPEAIMLLQAGTSGAIQSTAGDIFNWLKTIFDDVKNFFVQVVEGVYHFFITIGEALYTFVLDCYQTIVNVVEFVFTKIKVFLEDLIKWLGFLFQWNDILVTHKVMKKIFTLSVQNAIDSMTQVKGDIPVLFKKLQAEVNHWADIPNFDQTPDSTTGSNPALAGQNSSESNYGIYHFKNNAQNATSSHTMPSPPEAIFKDLMGLLAAEETTLKAAYDAIKTDIIDRFGSLTLTQIIKKFVAVVADTLLQTAENILLAAVDVFIQLANGVMGVLTATLNIPVLSWLYKKITGEDLSILDMICLIAAIPTNVVYKAVSGKTPFPQNAPFTLGVLKATNFAQLQALFYKAGPTRGIRHDGSIVLTTTADPIINDGLMNLLSFVTGIFALVGAIVMVICSVIQAVLDALKLQASKVVAAINAVANIAYISTGFPGMINLLTATWYQNFNNVVTAISALKGFILDIPLAGSKVSSWCECLLNVAWNVPVMANCIYNPIGSKGYYKALIPESIGNFAFNIGGMITPFPSLAKDPKVKAALYLTQYGMMGIYGVCMPIAGGIKEFDT